MTRKKSKESAAFEDETSSPEDSVAKPHDAPETAIEEAKSAGSDAETKSRKLTRKELMERLDARSQEIDRLTQENHEFEIKLKELNDRWLRTAAEFENYRKRTAKEWELLKQQAKADVILEVLSVVDDFERAFTVVEGEQSNGFVEGFRLIYNNLTQTLEKIGVKELDALHTPFDPQYHMAVSQVERDGLEAGLVAEVIQKGYELDGIVIRPAQVIVAK